MTHPLLPVILLVGLALGACTPMRLEHPQFGQSRLNQDAAECDELGRREAARMGMFDFMQPPRYVRDRNGNLRVVRSSFHEMEMNRWQRERDVSQICLSSRGYRLVPVEKP